MERSRWLRPVLVAFTTIVLTACLSTGSPGDPGRTRTGRTDEPQSPHPRGGVAARPCPLIGPIVAALKGSKYEREWKRVEKDLEPTLRDIIDQDVTAREALASLDSDVLGPHRWPFRATWCG